MARRRLQWTIFVVCFLPRFWHSFCARLESEMWDATVRSNTWHPPNLPGSRRWDLILTAPLHVYARSSIKKLANRSRESHLNAANWLKWRAQKRLEVAQQWSPILSDLLNPFQGEKVISFYPQSFASVLSYFSKLSIRTQYSLHWQQTGNWNGSAGAAAAVA